MDIELSYYLYTPIVLIGLIAAPSYLKNGRALLGIANIGCGVLANHDESLHFTQDNDENLICMETGEIMREVRRDEYDNIIEIEYCR
jgi:hypothetical protein